ncbi:MAG TPA: polysaccharide deacetylase family protein [Pyrinomonadaceae bacterium]|nr:polysaccharide deacetylase family protein [Pyrinomonadaceae bacterium]
MLKKFKQTTLGTLKSSGVFKLVENSRWRQRHLLILAYHGISLDDEHQWDPSLYMTADCFRQRMQLLKDSNCTVLPLAEAIRRLYSQDLPERCVALTFDDGNHDFYSRAWPILREFDFPVTVYLSTYYSLYPKPVFDVICSYLLWKGRKGQLDFRPITGQEMVVDLSANGSVAHTVAAILKFAHDHNLSAKDKDELAAKVAAQLNIDYEALIEKRLLHLMSPEEVKTLASEGVDIQLHTHRHRVPSERSLFMREIDDNKQSIQEITGGVASHFCYPSGVYSQSFLPWLEEAGVVSATTCDVGFASRQSHPLLLPRLLDGSGLSEIEFEGWLTGVSAALPRRREARQ